MHCARQVSGADVSSAFPLHPCLSLSSRYDQDFDKGAAVKYVLDPHGSLRR